MVAGICDRAVPFDTGQPDTGRRHTVRYFLC